MKIFIVDSFTKKSFKGNPAGVFIAHKFVTDEDLQNIATEMNLSETAFVIPRGNNTLKLEKYFELRWFTPTVEVELSGHATLAAAKVLYDHYENMNDVLCFNTKSGKLYCQKNKEKIEVRLPINLPDVQESLVSFEMCSNLRDEEILNCVYNKKTKKLLIEIDSFDKLKNLLFDFNKLRGMIFTNIVRGLIVTVKGDNEYDFYSRYFAPWVGVNEDSVTGSSHTLLYPYWKERLNKKRLVAKQLSKRSGIVEMYKRCEKVVLVGEAKIIMDGKFKYDVF